MPRRGDNIYRRKDNRWEGRYPCGYTAKGKTRYHSVYGKTYAEVKEKMLQMQRKRQHASGNVRMTVKALFDEWLLSISSRAKESTIANYKMKIRKHLLPDFGGMKYEMLNAREVQLFVQRKLQSGLSPRYVADIIVVFKSMTKYVSREYDCYNPLINVSLPKASQKAAVRILEPDEQRRLIEYLNKNRNRTSLGVLMSLYTGLRIGELCSLRWSDVNIQKRTLAVSHTIQRISGGDENHATRLVVTEPKSASSVRTIPLPDCLLDMLKQFESGKDTFVLSGNDKPVEPRTMQYRFTAILKKTGLPSVHFHSLRHLFATNCIRLGFDVKSLSEILGHSSVEITLNRYVHSSFEQKRTCMERLSIAV